MYSFLKAQNISEGWTFIGFDSTLEIKASDGIVSVKRGEDLETEENSSGMGGIIHFHPLL